MTDLDSQLEALEGVKWLIDCRPHLTKAQTFSEGKPGPWVLHGRDFWDNIPATTALAVRVSQATWWIEQWLIRDTKATWECEWKWFPDCEDGLRHVVAIIKTEEARSGREYVDELEAESLPELYALCVSRLNEIDEHDKELNRIRRGEAIMARHGEQAKCRPANKPVQIPDRCDEIIAGLYFDDHFPNGTKQFRADFIEGWSIGCGVGRFAQATQAEQGEET